ncbi:MAG: L-lactate dehydrogenase [Candidatus Bipolaricaulaceae bacterium]
MDNKQQARLRPHRVAIVGVGRVGSTYAYSLLLRGAVGEIVLVDIDRQRTEGEAMDLGHAAPLANPVHIWTGDYDDCRAADVVTVAAGVAQRPGESRMELLRRNAAVFSELIPQVAGQGVLLVATNPVDVMAHIAWKLSGLPAHRVIGSGTVLDTARFRHLLSRSLGVDPRNVHAYIIGEHGDSEVPAWSRTTVAGVPLDEFCTPTGCPFPPVDREGVFAGIRDAAQEIISRKGATYYAVAAALTRITDAILHDQHSVLSVSKLAPEALGLGSVYLSLPAVVGREGAERVISLPLSDDEQRALERSAALLKQAVGDLGY